MFTWPRHPGYIFTSVTLWAAFLVCLPALSWARQTGQDSAVIWSLAAFPGLSVLIQFWLAYRLIARQDEFARGLTAKRVMAAGGVTLAIVTGWSVAEQFAGAPLVPMWLAYPLFWGLFGAATPLIRDSRA